ncbi:unnamed protein product [Cylicostephanus goldi]|uniref:Uncharacterized protein n=1 Tax=Cylicostephanus goldi TaxID=71465 RepID=A0A3P6S063_CYLGO|nr:unnamed protein product [Cylicostephanus goldi]
MLTTTVLDKSVHLQIRNMSGWREIRGGVSSHGRMFDERIRELQLEIEHMRRLREAAAHERGEQFASERKTNLLKTPEL